MNDCCLMISFIICFICVAEVYYHRASSTARKRASHAVSEIYSADRIWALGVNHIVLLLLITCADLPFIGVGADDNISQQRSIESRHFCLVQTSIRDMHGTLMPDAIC